MKKIALLIPHLAGGGAGNAASRISKLLAKKYDVTIIVFSNKRIDYEYSGKIISIDLPSVSENVFKKIHRQLKRIKKIKELKTKNNYETVISFLDVTNIYNVLTKTSSCKTILSIRGNINIYFSDGFANVVKKMLLKQIYRKADAIITVSKKLKQIVSKECNVNTEKIYTIYNPYDIEEILKLSKNKKDISSEIKSKVKNKKIIVNMGQMVYLKGQWHIIKAFSLLCKEKNDIILMIIGEGPYRKNIEKLVKELSLENKVVLVDYTKNPFKLLAISDIYVLSSITEGFPNALVESMICGLPVIAGDCLTGPREILEENPDIDKIEENTKYTDYGVLTPRPVAIENWNKEEFTKGEKELALAMKTLLENKKMYQNYKIKNKKRVKEFSQEACLKKYIEVIEKTTS